MWSFFYMGKQKLITFECLNLFDFFFFIKNALFRAENSDRWLGYMMRDLIMKLLGLSTALYLKVSSMNDVGHTRTHMHT